MRKDGYHKARVLQKWTTPEDALLRDFTQIPLKILPLFISIMIQIPSQKKRNLLEIHCIPPDS